MPKQPSLKWLFYLIARLAIPLTFVVLLFVCGWIGYQRFGRIPIVLITSLVAPTLVFLTHKKEDDQALVGLVLLLACGFFGALVALSEIDTINPLDRSAYVVWYAVMGLGHGIVVSLPYILICEIRRRRRAGKQRDK
jgi:hypothetical protein